jgi:hypothetical protein
MGRPFCFWWLQYSLPVGIFFYPYVELRAEEEEEEEVPGWL